MLDKLFDKGLKINEPCSHPTLTKKREIFRVEGCSKAPATRKIPN